MSKRHLVQDATGVLGAHLPFGTVQLSGTTVPTDGAAGYAPGCIFHHVDGAAGTCLYANDGTAASCDFNPVATAGGGIAFDDNDLLRLGTDGDQVQLNRSATLDANTALTSALIGTPAVAAIPANSHLISNVTADGDQVFATVPAAGSNSIEWLRNDASAGLTVFNEASGDLDFRIESNVLSNFFVLDGNSCLNGQLALGGAVPTNPQAFLAILPAVNATGVTTNQSYYHQTLLPGAAVTIPAGTAPIVASMNIAEPNITATGTVTVAATVRIADAPTEGGSNYALWVDSGVTRLDGNLEFSAALDVVTAANTAAALEVTDGTTALYAIDTRSSVSVVSHTLQGPASQTLANGATARARTVSIPAKTVTLAGQTQVTTLMEGVQLEILAPTINQSAGAVTVDKVSTLFVGTAVAGSSVTITTNHIIMTGTAGCFCTAAGTWTDTSSALSKTDIRDADLDEVSRLMDEVDVVQFKKIDKSDGDYDRFGVIAENVPDFLASKERNGVASIYLAGFALAAAKAMKADNAILRQRLEALEKKLKP